MKVGRCQKIVAKTMKTWGGERSQAGAHGGAPASALAGSARLPSRAHWSVSRRPASVFPTAESATTPVPQKPFPVLQAITGCYGRWHGKSPFLDISRGIESGSL